MSRSVLSSIFILVILASAALAADITGNWSGTMSMGDNQFNLSYTFKQDGGKLTGSVTPPNGSALPLIDGKVEGDKVSFAVKVDMNGSDAKFTSSGTIKGEEIALTTTAEGHGDFPPSTMTLKRTN